MSSPHMSRQERYLQLMMEVSFRLKLLKPENLISLRWPPTVTRELAYLQLRICCEIVALASLVAHGDIPETNSKRFQKEYAAKDLIKKLESVNPEAFPRTLTYQIINGTMHFSDAVGSNFMSREQMIAIYERSGDYLHRGNIKKVSMEISAIDSDISDVTNQAALMWNMLVYHGIKFPNGSVLVCGLESGPGGSPALILSDPI